MLPLSESVAKTRDPRHEPSGWHQRAFAGLGCIPERFGIRFPCQVWPDPAVLPTPDLRGAGTAGTGSMGHAPKQRVQDLREEIARYIEMGGTPPSRPPGGIAQCKKDRDMDYTPEL